MSVEGFAERFDRGSRPPCQLYLISPQDVGGAFPDRLKAALDGGPGRGVPAARQGCRAA